MAPAVSSTGGAATPDLANGSAAPSSQSGSAATATTMVIQLSQA